MTAADKQIVESYEANGMSSSEIAEALGYEEDAVKLSLAQFSSKFYADNKEALKNNEKPLFDAQALEQAKQAMSGCMYAENDAVRFRAAEFIINECKGRNDVNLEKLKSLRTTNISINLISDQMARAQEALKRVIAKPTQQLEAINA